LSASMEEALNDQVVEEFASAYLYLALSAWFASESLPGFAGWMRIQAGEEAGHALKFFDFIIDRGGQVSLKAIDAPAARTESALAVFEHVLDHERAVTASIHALHDRAVAENDHACLPFLLGFISEQIEEERTAEQIVEQLRMIGEGKAGLLVLDHHLGKRES
jgi:ferritin